MKKVHCIYSINKNDLEDSLIFGTRKRAEQWLTNWIREEQKVFQNSDKNELYICTRIVF